MASAYLPLFLSFCRSAGPVSARQGVGHLRPRKSRASWCLGVLNWLAYCMSTKTYLTYHPSPGQQLHISGSIGSSVFKYLFTNLLGINVRTFLCLTWVVFFRCLVRGCGKLCLTNILFDTKRPGDSHMISGGLKLCCQRICFVSFSLRVDFPQHVVFKQKPCKEVGAQGGIKTEPKRSACQVRGS
jgi:hypothetical protein